MDNNNTTEPHNKNTKSDLIWKEAVKDAKHD